ncbi:MAG: hypothetical protein AAB074_13085 [Planctomycetota bacterium]
MNRILTIAALALFVFGTNGYAEDDKRAEPGSDGKAEGKEGKVDEKKDREARAWAEKKAAEFKRWSDEKKKCERDGHHRCGAGARKGCENRDCERKGHRKCQDEARAKCKGACEEIRAKAKKDKAVDIKGDEKKKIDAKPGDIVPGGKKDGDGKCDKDEKPADGDGKCDKGCDDKAKDEEKAKDEPKDEEGDGLGDLK